MNPRWSPDGKWIAYLSDKTGDTRSILPEREGRTRITTDGGVYRWAGLVPQQETSVLGQAPPPVVDRHRRQEAGPDRSGRLQRHRRRRVGARQPVDRLLQIRPAGSRPALPVLAERKAQHQDLRRLLQRHQSRLRSRRESPVLPVPALFLSERRATRPAFQLLQHRRHLRPDLEGRRTLAREASK